MTSTSAGRDDDPTFFYPNAVSEDEIHCLLVIVYVGTEAPPEQAAELTGRLHAELDAMLRDGTLRLPDPKGAPALAVLNL